MKYRLKKDLPFAKAGIIINVANCDHRDSTWSIFNRTLFASKSDIKDLISDGWIEEVKPMEFNLVVDDFGRVYGEALPGESIPLISRVIKVREVID